MTVFIYLLSQSQEDTDRKKTLEDVNQVLLRNILPKHVAEHFLGKNNESVYTVSYSTLCSQKYWIYM